MSYSADTFVADEQPTTAKWNKLWSNDASFNDGTGIGDDTIDSRHYVAGSIDPEHLASTVWGWEEIGRTTLGSAGDSLSVSFTAKKYLHARILLLATGGAIDGPMRFNSDSGSNYTHRFANDQAEDTTSTSASSINLKTSAATNAIITMDIMNIAAQEKIWSANANIGSAAGAANVPTRREMAGKWANTSVQISSIALTNGGAGDYAIGSEIVVLGHD